ncbi:MAG: hypothetical protein IPJ77_01485 [Planctomycetes bacterium]|nr:hypothetical protein [Planctomycetota bacterium]
MSTAASETASTGSTAAPKRGIDARWFSATLLTVILFVGQWKFQILGDDYTGWLTALGSAVITEFVFHWLHTGKLGSPLSAYISGNSVAILVKPQGSLLWPYVIGSVLAILSKYVLRYDKKHLYNPTNFSICALLLLAPGAVSILSHQWGNDPAMIAVIWTVGLLVVTRAKVVHLTVGYLVLFAFFAWVRTLFNGQSLGTELAPVTGPMYQLFMFFMVTDPKTIVSGRKQQFGVLFLIALSECLIRIGADREWLSTDNPLCIAPPMFALFIVGAPLFWLQLWRQKKAA